MTAFLLTLTDGKVYLALLALVLASALFEIVCIERRIAVAIRIPIFCFNLFLTTLLIGLRWQVGTDWESYKALFDDLELNSQFLLNVYHFDPGYVLLNAIVKAIFNNYTFFLLVCGTLAMSLVAKLIIRRSPVYNLALFVFLSAYLPIHFFGSIRRGIAIGAAGLFLAAIEKRRAAGRWKWLGMAFLFHRTALALLVVEPFRRTRFNPRIATALVIGSMFIGLAGLSITLIQLASTHLLNFSDVQIVDQLIYYGETFNEHTPDGVNPVVAGLVSFARKMILFFFFTAVVGKTAPKSGTDPLYDHLLKIYVIGMMLYGIFIGAPIFQIVSVYFLYVEILLIPMCLMRLGPRIRYVFLAYVILANLAQYVSALTVQPELFLPYRAVFF